LRIQKIVAYLPINNSLKKNTMRKFAKYQQNLSHDYEFIYSYKTKVAKITDDGVVKLGYWSMTTSKHINYAAKELNSYVRQ